MFQHQLTDNLNNLIPSQAFVVGQTLLYGAFFLLIQILQQRLRVGLFCPNLDILNVDVNISASC